MRTTASNRVRSPLASTVTADTLLTRSLRGSGPVVVNASATKGRLTSGSSLLVTKGLKGPHGKRLC